MVGGLFIGNRSLLKPGSETKKDEIVSKFHLLVVKELLGLEGSSSPLNNSSQEVPKPLDRDHVGAP